MRKQLITYSTFLLLAMLCVFGCQLFRGKKSVTIENSFVLDTLKWFDSSRSRLLPVAIYKPASNKTHAVEKVVILSHGYSENHPHAYLGYSFLSEYLAKHGIMVISIQHELPTDSLIPTTGNIQEVRRPFWERGAKNIGYVLQKIKSIWPTIKNKNITLLGHSIGGDMSALFATKYPDKIGALITLDNRRVALPRSKSMQVLSLRSSDQPADAGVLPTDAEIKLYGIKIIKLPSTTHNDMCDNGTEIQKKEMVNYVWEFLKN